MMCTWLDTYVLLQCVVLLRKSAALELLHPFLDPSCVDGWTISEIMWSLSLEPCYVLKASACNFSFCVLILYSRRWAEHCNGYTVCAEMDYSTTFDSSREIGGMRVQILLIEFQKTKEKNPAPSRLTLWLTCRGNALFTEDKRKLNEKRKEVC